MKHPVSIERAQRDGVWGYRVSQAEVGIWYASYEAALNAQNTFLHDGNSKHYIMALRNAEQTLPTQADGTL